MTENQTFVARRLEETIGELDSVRQKLLQTGKELDDARSVIRFYADVKNWKETDSIAQKVQVTTMLLDSEPASNSSNTMIAGRRARAYLNRNEISDS